MFSSSPRINLLSCLVLSCLVLSCLVLSCLVFVLSCLVLFCLVLSLSCLVLSCLVLSCLVLSYSCLILSCLVLSYSCLILSCLVLSCHILVLSCLVLSCLVLSCLVLSCLVLSCLVLSCLVLSCLVLSWRQAIFTHSYLFLTCGGLKLTITTSVFTYTGEQVTFSGWSWFIWIWWAIVHLHLRILFYICTHSLPHLYLSTHAPLILIRLSSKTTTANHANPKPAKPDYGRFYSMSLPD